jgi:hypothetical protein
VALLLGLFLRRSSGHFFPAAVVATAVTLAPITPSFHDGAIGLLMFLPAALCLDSVPNELLSRRNAEDDELVRPGEPEQQQCAA